MIKSASLDKLAVLLSGVCLVHCLLAPITITVLPIFGINALFEDQLFHQLMLFVVLPTSIIALFIGCRKHRKPLIAISGVIGMLILFFVAFWGHQLLGESNEKIATSIAGLVLAFSHTLNYRACQNIICEDSNCRSQHHH